MQVCLMLVQGGEPWVKFQSIRNLKFASTTGGPFEISRFCEKLIKPTGLIWLPCGTGK